MEIKLQREKEHPLQGNEKLSAEERRVEGIPCYFYCFS